MSQEFDRPHLVSSRITVKKQSALDDAPQRAAALDTQRSFLVEASAGSGKTELLIQRYLKLLALVEEPEQILALTFTLKAAAEMRDRILQEMRDAEDESALQELSANKQFTRSLAVAALEAGRLRGWHSFRPRKATRRWPDRHPRSRCRSHPYRCTARPTWHPFRMRIRDRTHRTKTVAHACRRPCHRVDT